jgi:integrase
MEAMPRPRKPYVNREVSRHGKVTWYFRKGDGPRFRLHGVYESPDWLADYDAALAGEVRKTPTEIAGTLHWLVQRYYESTAFVGLKEATQKQRKSILNRVVNGDGGSKKLSEITTKKIAEGRDKRSATPAQAVAFVKAMRGLYKWATEAQLVAIDPTIGVVAADPKTDGHHTWTIEEVRQFETRFPIGTRPRLALDIMLYTGMRISDAILFGRQHVRGGVIGYRSLKTGTDVVIPLLEPLRQSIEATPGCDMAFMATEFGTPWASVNSCGNWFRKQCRKAGVPGRAHGLRKAGATIAAENGASDRQLMAMFGWSTERQAGVYTRRADRTRLAQVAAERLEIGTSIPAPAFPVRGSGRKVQ